MRTIGLSGAEWLAVLRDSMLVLISVAGLFGMSRQTWSPHGRWGLFL
ncbi:hypothetical protein [Streptomyces sp. S465]|nr:hypothetical protein [Streptomyces sp. S465]WAP57703.1 hypothetical protein N6H00_23610 [Streptomyces sp. S465]